jgi:hypothetical protein
MAPQNDADFKLQNIGDSAAFDVDVSSLEVPKSRLETERIPYLLPGSPVSCIHRLSPPRGRSGLMAKAALFLEDAKPFFDGQSEGGGQSSDVRRRIEFAISYRSLDGRRFEQPYALVVFFPQQEAWVEPAVSLLEASGK